MTSCPRSLVHNHGNAQPRRNNWDLYFKKAEDWITLIYRKVQISSIRIQRARSGREMFRPAPVGAVLFFWLRFYRQDDPSVIRRQSWWGRGALRWTPKTTLALRQPRHETSNPQLMGFWGSIYIHLHPKRDPAPSRNTYVGLVASEYCNVLYCRTPVSRKVYLARQATIASLYRALTLFSPQFSGSYSEGLGLKSRPGLTLS